MITVVNTNILGDRLAGASIWADQIVGDNPNAKSAAKMKFPKKVPEDIKKLAKFYKFYKHDRRPPVAYAYMKMAWDIYASYRDNSSPKWMIEALILGDCSSKAIARYTGIHERAVSFYRKFYFDIKTIGNRQQLVIKSCSMFLDMVEGSESEWGYKVEVMVNGVDWFVSVRINKTPSPADIVKRDELVAQRMGEARLDTSALMGNEANYRRQSFLDKINATGATYKHVQADVAQNSKRGSGAGDLVGEELSDLMLETMQEVGVNPNDTRETAFGKDLPKEEILPIN